MKYNAIPDTKISVSAICLGTMTFGDPVGEKDSIEIIHRAMDEGINFIDTANMYEGYSRYVGSAGGVAEEIIGKAVKGRRDNIVIATKVGMKVGTGVEDEGTSPQAIRVQLDKSLKRLQTDYVDIYYVHKFDPGVKPEEIVLTLDSLAKEGKIRHYAVSNYSAEQLDLLVKTAASISALKPVMCQPHYSLLDRSVEKDMLPLCLSSRIAVVPYRVLEGGMLTGKYSRGQAVPDNSRGAEKSEWMPELNEKNFLELDAVREAASKSGLSMTQYAVNGILENPAVASVIIGVKRFEQLSHVIEGLVN